MGDELMSRGPQTFKERDATRLARAAVAAGLSVRAIEADAKSGKITVFTGENTAAPESSMVEDDLDRELAEFENRNGQG
jgi:hypothetical protein